ELEAMLPPRRLWSRPKRKERVAKSCEDVNALAIERTATRLSRSQEHRYAPWVLRLRRLISEEQDEALLSTSYRLEPRRLRAVEKDGRGQIFRALGVYSLRDRIVGGLCARYLRRAFDADFLPNSYAFRTAPRGSLPPKHHEAAKCVYDFRASNPDWPLWVAEC